MALDQKNPNILRIVDVDSVQFAIIKSWNKLKWDRNTRQLSGVADIELLDKLAGIVKLPPAIEKRREDLHAIRDAVDRERMNPDPAPLIKPPVKIPLYAHQVRGFNMCLLTFGWANPSAKERG